MKRLLFIPDPPEGGGGTDTAPKSKTPAELRAENEALQKRIAELEAAKAEKSEEEKEIAIKVGKGLTRDQAISVIRRQKEHDAAVAKLWESRRPAIIEALKDNSCLKGPINKAARLAIREINPTIMRNEIEAAQASAAKK